MDYSKLKKDELVSEIAKLERDLIRYKRINESLTIAKDQYRLHSNLLNAVEQAVIVTNLDEEITFWNSYAEQVYGWSAKEVIGRSIMDITVPQLSQTQSDEMMVQLRAGKSWSGEFFVG